MAKGAPDYSPWAGQKRTNATGGASIFAQTITIPINTAIGAPVTQDIILAKGFVSQLEIVLPLGCAGLAGVSIFNGATQLYPGTAGTWFTGDNEHIQVDCDFDTPLIAGVYKLTIKGYNLDDSYPHAPIIRVWIVFYP